METTMQDKELLEKMVAFINDIGIQCRPGVLEEGTFLPGIEIQHGGIVYDERLMKYPGDLLHEAGHLAVLLPVHRAAAHASELQGDIVAPAQEMGAIAWSWAALTYLGLDAEVVFHEQGYKGGSDSLITAFNDGGNIGAPLLHWIGMTKEPKRGVRVDEHTFPKMIHWLRQPK